MSLGATCPSCRTLFAFDESDVDDEVDDGHLTCPNCMRSFDPFAGRRDRRDSDDDVGIEDLIDHDEDNEDEDP